ncbi:hypothetical protein ABZ897_31205 [Nonomuraea sp. NPDC046802]|uniref:hypothetical protein n=1 Tax=Nonomuraea sp. NPDC046802 TaxID=3154919 RepID=UPI00340B9D69
MEPERSSRSPWLTGSISAGLASATGVAVNIATENVENMVAWTAVAGLTVAAGLFAGFVQMGRSTSRRQEVVETPIEGDTAATVSASVFEATFTIQKDNVLRSAQVKISDVKVASQWIKSFDWQQIEGKGASDDK